MALLDGDVLVVGGVASADLRSFLHSGVSAGTWKPRAIERTHGVEGNGERATGLDASGLAGVIDNGLVVLIGWSVLRRGARKKTENTPRGRHTSYEPWEKFIRTTFRPAAIPCQLHDRGIISRILAVHLRRMLIFSTEFVLGPKEGRKKMVRTAQCGRRPTLLRAKGKIEHQSNRWVRTYQWFR